MANHLFGRSAADILDAIRESPPIAAALGEAESQRVARRQAKLDRLAAIDRDAAGQFPKLIKDTSDAVAAQRRAEAALVVAKQKVDVAMAARLDFTVQTERERRQLQAELRAGADGQSISAFAEWIEDSIQAAARSVRVPVVERSEVGAETVITVTSNVGSINSRCTALRAARDEVEALRLVADQSSVPSRIAALKAGIPPIADEITAAKTPRRRNDVGQFGVIQNKETE